MQAQNAPNATSNSSQTEIFLPALPSDLPKEPQSPLRLLETAFYILRKSFGRVIPFYILYLGLIFAWNILSLLCGPKAACLETGVMWATATIVYIIGLYFVLSFFTAGRFQFLNVTQNKFASFGEASNFGFRKAIPMFLMYVVNTIAVIIGFILLIIPGIFLAVSFIFGSLFLVMGSGPVDSLSHSYHLVKGHWWRMLLNIIVVSLFIILIALIYFLITLVPVYYVGFLYGLVVEQGKEMIVAPSLLILISFIMIIFQFFSTLYIASFLFASLYDLTLRKREGSK